MGSCCIAGILTLIKRCWKEHIFILLLSFILDYYDSDYHILCVIYLTLLLNIIPGANDSDILIAYYFILLKRNSGKLH